MCNSTIFSGLTRLCSKQLSFPFVFYSYGLSVLVLRRNKVCHPTHDTRVGLITAFRITKKGSVVWKLEPTISTDECKSKCLELLKDIINTSLSLWAALKSQSLSITVSCLFSIDSSKGRYLSKPKLN